MVKRIALERGSLHDRIQARRPFGTLHDNIVKPATYKRYCICFLAFISFLQLRSHCVDSLSDLDMGLCSYLEELWEEGIPKNFANYSIAALKHFAPLCKRMLFGSERLVKAWGKLELPARATPFTPLIVTAMAGLAERLNHRRIACAFIIMFHCLLRTGEFFLILRRHVTFNASRTRAVIALYDTKTSFRLEAAEIVTVDDPTVVRCVAELCGGLAPGDRILPESVTEFRAVFNQCLEILGLKSYGFKPYSLRRGGATWDFRSHGRMERTVIRGRWASVRTARIYINDGVAALASLLLTPMQVKVSKLAAKGFLQEREAWKGF